MNREFVISDDEEAVVKAYKVLTASFSRINFIQKAILSLPQVLLGIAVAVYMMLALGSEEFLRRGVYLLMGAIIIERLLAHFYYPYLRLRFEQKIKRPTPSTYNLTIRFEDRKITTINGKIKVLLPWETLEEIIEFKGYLFFYFQGTVYFYLPEKCFDRNDEMTEFKDACLAKVEKNRDEHEKK